MNYEQERKYAEEVLAQIRAEVGEDDKKLSKALLERWGTDERFYKACQLIGFKDLVEEQKTRH